MSFTYYRIWYVHVSGARKTALENMPPTEVGYMNVIPKCLDTSGKYPVYENLPETYAAINSYITDVPLEGMRRPSIVDLSETLFVS